MEATRSLVLEARHLYSRSCLVADERSHRMLRRLLLGKMLALVRLRRAIVVGR